MCIVSNKIVLTINPAQKMKCFDNYLSMVSQLYYGLPIIQTFGNKTGNKNDPSSSSFTLGASSLQKKGEGENNNGIHINLISKLIGTLSV